MPVLIAEESSHEPAARARRGPRLGLLLALAALIYAACAARAESSRDGRGGAKAAADVEVVDAKAADGKAAEVQAPEVEGVRLGDVLVRDEALTYGGYTVRRRQKEVRDADAPEGRGEVSYVVLERGGKVLRSFDAGVHRGGLNAAGFGLFPFLGGATKQLVISQDAPREGRQWIVSLAPRPRVIYDGAAFAAGRELDDLRAFDLDGDGVYEISAPLCGFYGFRDWALAPADTPLPEVIFKYDAKAGKYLPANELFRARLLKGVGEAKAKVRGPSARGAHAADVLAILLNHVFAGEERAGWEFYEAAYRLPDKAEFRREVEAALRAQPVYRFMRGRRAAS